MKTKHNGLKKGTQIKNRDFAGMIIFDKKLKGNIFKYHLYYKGKFLFSGNSLMDMKSFAIERYKNKSKGGLR